MYLGFQSQNDKTALFGAVACLFLRQQFIKLLHGFHNTICAACGKLLARAEAVANANARNAHKPCALYVIAAVANHDGIGAIQRKTLLYVTYNVLLLRP